MVRAGLCAGRDYRLRSSDGVPRAGNRRTDATSAACHAWGDHIARLIDRHRIACELDDDQPGNVIRRFYEALYSCSAHRF
jgi:hypothetical protein